jgi:hypothetical protein
MGLDADGIELSLGQAQDQAFVLNGRAHVNLGERPAFNAEISSRQVDLDRMLGGGAADPVNLDAGWASAGTLVRWIDQMTVPGEVSFDIPAIVLGGSVIRDIGFNATYSPGLPVSLENLVATFPGETSFGFTGAVGAVGDVAGTDLALDGIMTLESAAHQTFLSAGRRADATRAGRSHSFPRLICEAAWWRRRAMFRLNDCAARSTGQRLKVRSPIARSLVLVARWTLI